VGSEESRSESGQHKVSFEAAITVFADPLARIFDDVDHSGDERREVIVGHSAQQDLLLVSFTATDDRVRVLSARKTTRRERKDYEENISS
jgi:uncharacterized DUF497 family protein